MHKEKRRCLTLVRAAKAVPGGGVSCELGALSRGFGSGVEGEAAGAGAVPGVPTRWDSVACRLGVCTNSAFSALQEEWDTKQGEMRERLHVASDLKGGGGR